MFDIISILLNLWCLICDPRCGLSWRIFHVHLRRRVYFSVFGWNVLKISLRSISSNVSFKTCVSLLIFSFDDLFIGVSGVLKSPTIIVLLEISPFMSLAKSLQSCPTLCDPIHGSPPGSVVPGILQARTLEWVAISFSNAWKWKVKVKSLSRVRLFATPWTAAHQAPPSMEFSRQEYWSGVPLPSLFYVS